MHPRACEMVAEVLQYIADGIKVKTVRQTPCMRVL